MTFLKKHKKKIIISFTSGLAVILVGGFALFQVAKQNVNYSMEQAKEVAVEKIGGEVMLSEVEQEFLTRYYEFTMLDDNNRPIDVTLNATTGEIVELDYD